jgi:hypothetical protein
MTTKPIIQDHNVETNEVVTREMTDSELEQYEKDMQLANEKMLAQQIAEAAKETAKETAQAKLAALGLTIDDLKALGLN